MLGNYEKKMYFEILEKMLKRKSKTMNFIRSLDNTFENLLCESNFSKTHKKSTSERIDIYREHVENALKKLSRASKSLVCKKIEYFSEIFNLNQADLVILKIAVYYKIIYEFEQMIDEVCKERHNYGINIKCVHLITSISQAKIEKSFQKLTNLGILDYDDTARITRKIEKLFLDYGIKTKAKVIEYMLGNTIKPNFKIQDFNHLKEDVNIVQNIIASAVKTDKKGVNILFWGDVGTGKTELVKTIASACKINLYEVSGTDDDGYEMSRTERLYDFKRKQEVLKTRKKSCLLFDEMEDIIESGFKKNGSKAYLNRMLENSAVPTFWTTNDIEHTDNAFLRRMTYAVRFNELSDDIRLSIWQKELRKNKLKIDKNKLIELNESYEIPPALITNAINTTKMTKGSQNDFEKYVTSIATLVNKGKNMKKIQAASIKNYSLELVNANLDIEYLTDKIVKKSKLNFSLCLYGQSGTGKSAYARHLAKKLGVKVVFKKASDLISPYVGQTEINISKAFEKAKDEKAMLIIDEADSFLQSRTMAQRSWEISQVNEMLTCMENHEYPFVCTTNLIDILDEASLRRFTFKIKFDFLNKKQIEHAFKHFFNLSAPQDIATCYGLTSGDFAVVSKKAEYIDCENKPSEYAKLLKDEVGMKSKDIVTKSFGF